MRIEKEGERKKKHIRRERPTEGKKWDEDCGKEQKKRNRRGEYEKGGWSDMSGRG